MCARGCVSVWACEYIGAREYKFLGVSVWVREYKLFIIMHKSGVLCKIMHNLVNGAFLFVNDAENWVNREIGQMLAFCLTIVGGIKKSTNKFHPPYAAVLTQN